MRNRINNAEGFYSNVYCLYLENRGIIKMLRGSKITERQELEFTLKGIRYKTVRFNNKTNWEHYACRFESGNWWRIKDDDLQNVLNGLIDKISDLEIDKFDRTCGLGYDFNY